MSSVHNNDYDDCKRVKGDTEQAENRLLHHKAPSVTTPPPTASTLYNHTSHPNAPDEMISDTALTDLSNGLGVTAMVLIVVYHFVAVNGRRMQEV